MTIEEIKNEVAKEKGFENWNAFKSQNFGMIGLVDTDYYWPEVCKRYATKCCKATQKIAGIRIEEKMKTLLSPERYQGMRVAIDILTDESNIILV